MLTAHATLRDRYLRRARLLVLGVMAFSITSLVLALANDDQQISILGLEGRLQSFLAALAGVTFFVSVVDLVVGWPTQAAAHAEAAKQLGELNLVFARAEVENERWSVPDKDLAVEYARVMGAIAPIPDMKAASLKARHNRKREVFTLADQRPGSPTWWLRCTVLWRSMFGSQKSRKAAKITAPPEADPVTPDLPKEQGPADTDRPRS